MALVRTGGLALVLALLATDPAAATIIEGVEFTNPVAVDVPGGTNLLLTTSEDVFVFAPNGLLADLVDIVATVKIVVDAPIDASQISFCTDPTVCPTGEFDLQQDAVVTVMDPVGSFQIEAGGSVVVSTTPIPEPATSFLVGLGLLALSAWRRPPDGRGASR